MKEASGAGVVGTCEEEMVDGLFCGAAAVRAEGGVGAFDSMEGFVEGDVAGSELEKEAGLVAAELRCNVEEVV